jgi:metal-responsive CopG/Arc/MetJ family transcriptional regulator
MAKSAKVAFSIDQRLLERVERIRARTGESRSAVIARALALVTDAEANAERVRRYEAAYREQPETDGDEQTARVLAKRALKRMAAEKR